MLVAMVGVNRSSESMSRKDRAAATRRRILEAARELFIEHGYASSTMQSIADRAGVAVQTVYFVFHTKGELLRQLILSFGGRDDEPVETMDRDWVHQAMTDADGRRSVALLVEHGTDIYARIAPLWAAFGQGAAVEPEVAETWQGIVEARRAGIHRIVDSLADRGHLRHDLAVDRAADIVYGLHRPESLAVLVGECGWSLPEYKAWMYRLLCDQLLDPRPDPEPDQSPTRGLSYDPVPDHA
jgi:AcrR family transcriptional regulator